MSNCRPHADAHRLFEPRWRNAVTFAARPIPFWYLLQLAWVRPSAALIAPNTAPARLGRTLSKCLRSQSRHETVTCCFTAATRLGTWTAGRQVDSVLRTLVTTYSTRRHTRLKLQAQEMPVR